VRQIAFSDVISDVCCGVALGANLTLSMSASIGFLTRCSHFVPNLRRDVRRPEVTRNAWGALLNAPLRAYVYWIV
jgi:hypothetical protein